MDCTECFAELNEAKSNIRPESRRDIMINLIYPKQIEFRREDMKMASKIPSGVSNVLMSPKTARLKDFIYLF